jgi:hypothetical protein
LYIFKNNNRSFWKCKSQYHVTLIKITTCPNQLLFFVVDYELLKNYCLWILLKSLNVCFTNYQLLSLKKIVLIFYVFMSAPNLLHKILCFDFSYKHLFVGFVWHCFNFLKHFGHFFQHTIGFEACILPSSVKNSFWKPRSGGFASVILY